MLWCRREDGKLLAADGEEQRDAEFPPRPSRRFQCSTHAASDRRLVRSTPHASATQGQAGLLASSNGMRRHLRGIEVRGIDDRLDLLDFEMVHQTFDAAKAADPRRQGLSRRRRSAASQRQGRHETVVVGELPGERRGFRSAAEDENAHCRIDR